MTEDYRLDIHKELASCAGHCQIHSAVMLPGIFLWEELSEQSLAATWPTLVVDDCVAPIRYGKPDYY